MNARSEEMNAMNKISKVGRIYEIDDRLWFGAGEMTRGGAGRSARGKTGMSMFRLDTSIPRKYPGDRQLNNGHGTRKRMNTHEEIHSTK